MWKLLAKARRKTRGTFLAAGMFLVNCQGTMTVDLATQAPADPDVQQIAVSLLGLELRKNDGTTQTLEFSASELVDLMEHDANDDVLRLFSDEQLPEGTYTGVRLLFDADNADDAFVRNFNGTQADLSLTDGEYADISFTVSEEETNREALTLTLDLRQSLRFDDSGDEYVLKPLLRSAVTAEASSVEGTVMSSCPFGTSLANGAVYLFQGEDIVPDDRDGAQAEPYLTAPVLGNGISGVFTYRVAFVPAGEYTVALTCRGDDEDPTEDNDLDFRSISNVILDEGETVELNLG